MGLKLAIAGAKGRMGQALLEVIANTPSITLVAASLHPSERGTGQPVMLAGEPSDIRYCNDAVLLFEKADCVVDFTSPDATGKHALLAADTKTPLVVGTTGLDDKAQVVIEQASQKTPVFQAANFSLGVNLLAAITQLIAARLDPDWDIEVLEMHHRYKLDAPSGTALLLGQAAAKGRNVDLTQRAVQTRAGHTGERRQGDIGFATLRGGTVAGDHSVIFAGDHERLELRHHAESRIIFAQGAIKASQWLHGKGPGLYGPIDMLGLEALLG